jgi:RNA polymerase sigma factor (sigma-70 family)
VHDPMDTPTAFFSGAPPSGAARSAPTDRAIVLAGDDALGFTDFYRRNRRAVAAALALTVGDPELGAEAADEGMIRAYSRWSSVRGYDNPAGWVYRVGLNWARSYHRRAARLIPFGDHDHAATDAVTDPAIQQALLRLDVKHRAVVVCRLLLDWSVEDTAAALDVAPGTVKSRLHRALQTLQPALDPRR